VPLGFLGEGNYISGIYCDASDWAGDPKNMYKNLQNITSADALNLQLVSGGGAAVPIWKL